MSLITHNDRFAIFGARGMAGSAISRALDFAGYQKQLKPSRDELDLLDSMAVQHWLSEHKPDVVVLAAAKVGGIHANNTYPADFLLDNLKIQTHVIENAWRSGCGACCFLVAVAFIRNLLSSRSRKNHYFVGHWSPLMSGTRSPKSLGLSSAKRLESNMALMRSA